MRELESIVEQQWNALGALASSVLRQAAEARAVKVGQLYEAEAAQGEAAYVRRGQPKRSNAPAINACTSAQLELPFA